MYAERIPGKSVGVYMMKKKGSPLKKRLNMLLVICLIPLAVLTVYLLVMINRFSERYDTIVRNITMANAYNIDFKEDMDYLMYMIVVNSERAEELVDTKRPYEMIDEAREVFGNLYELADGEYARSRIKGILKSLDALENSVTEIEESALITGYYDANMVRLDLNIRILTDIVQEQIQKYIYYEAMNLENIREGIRSDVDRAIQMSILIFLLILTGAFLVSRRIMTGITGPIRRLCEVTKQAASGDFAVRAQEGSNDELAVLNASFNQMVEKIGNLVESIRVEQLNQRVTELKLLQAQINPHFLYNTLDAIIWLAESNQNDQVVMMVSSLSDFFRTTLSKGRDYITVQEEETHIRSYLQIQQLRYRDVLEYEIQIPEELYSYQILKLTLQPLVENALYHGIKNKRGLGHILVTGEELNGTLLFRVFDDGMGMNPNRLENVRRIISGEMSDEDNPSGFGLFNVDQRLRLNYGSEYGLQIDSEYGDWTEVLVTLPAVKK